jgi:predicted ArsR family transcriptional regulator
MSTKLDKRFFGSTRGQIVSLLRGSKHTVNELAAELDLTDNAVRAHLLSLERDGLIRQSGIQKGTRKPHFSYELTNDAESLFPKAYDALVNQLITVLKGKLSADALTEILREVGRSLAHNQGDAPDDGDLTVRAAKGLSALDSIGGSATMEEENGKIFIRGNSCPLASAVNQHPEVCQLAESLLSEIMNAKVHEQCDRQGHPKCAFEVTDEQTSSRAPNLSET